MIVQIRDRAALSTLSFVSLQAYLESHGWNNEGPWGQRPATIYSKEYGGGTWEILAPTRDTVADYAEAMGEAVAVLAEVEERSQLDVFYDLISVVSTFSGEDTRVLDDEGSKYLFDLGGIYGVAEAGRYLKAAPHAETLYPVSSRTLRGWIRQRCVKTDGDEFPVAFDDLIAMRVIAALRSAGVSRREISDSESLLQEETGVRHPMATEVLWAGEGEPFFKWRQCLVDSGNRARSALDLVQEYLMPARDLVFDETSGQVISWEPQPGIVLDPLVQFGAPCIKATRIPTGAISGMIEAGDSAEWTARAYGILLEEVQAACDWESRFESV